MKQHSFSFKYFEQCIWFNFTAVCWWIAERNFIMRKRYNRFCGWYPDNSLHAMRSDLRQVEAMPPCHLTKNFIKATRSPIKIPFIKRPLDAATTQNWIAMIISSKQYHYKTVHMMNRAFIHCTNGTLIISQTMFVPILRATQPFTYT